MRGLRLLHAVRIAVGVPVTCRAGLHLFQHLAALPLVLAEHRDRDHRVRVRISRKRVAAQDAGQRIRVVHIFDVERCGERLAVPVEALDRNHLVKPVDAQLDRRVDVDADERGRGEIDLIPAPAAQQHQHQTGERGDQPQAAGQGAARRISPVCEGGAGARLERFVRMDLVKRLPDTVTHRPHLPAFRAAAVWRGSAACKPC